MSTAIRPAYPEGFDIAPITRRTGEPVTLAIGDQVTVHFNDPIEGAHSVAGEVVDLFLHNRVAVLIGQTKFSVPAENCELGERQS